MSSGILPAAYVSDPSVAVAPRFEPYVAEIVLSFPLGSADEAVKAAADTVAELLANAHLTGGPSADTPPVTDESTRIATTAFVAAYYRELTAPLMLEAVIPNAPGFGPALADVLTSFAARPEFQAAFTAMFKTWAAGLPVYSGTGAAPVPAGEPFLNDGTPQIAK